MLTTGNEKKVIQPIFILPYQKRKLFGLMPEKKGILLKLKLKNLLHLTGGKLADIIR